MNGNVEMTGTSSADAQHRCRVDSWLGGTQFVVQPVHQLEHIRPAAEVGAISGP
jgi:hypothetical protein